MKCSSHEVTDTSEEEYSCFRILLFKIRHNKKRAFGWNTFNRRPSGSPTLLSKIF